MAATIPMRRDKTREAKNRLPRQTAAHRCIKTTNVADTYTTYTHRLMYQDTKSVCARKKHGYMHTLITRTLRTGASRAAVDPSQQHKERCKDKKATLY